MATPELDDLREALADLHATPVGRPAPSGSPYSASSSGRRSVAVEGWACARARRMVAREGDRLAVGAQVLGDEGAVGRLDLGAAQAGERAGDPVRVRRAGG